MSWIDVLIIIIFAASTAFGFWRGFTKELIAIATWLAAIWLAWQASWIFEPYLGDWDAAPELRIWTARIVIFVVVLILGGLIAWMFRALIRRTVLSGTDRTLGAGFGLARGALILGLITIGLELADLDQERWWQSARFRPFSETIADGILYYAGLGSRYLEEQELV